MSSHLQETVELVEQAKTGRLVNDSWRLIWTFGLLSKAQMDSNGLKQIDAKAVSGWNELRSGALGHFVDIHNYEPQLVQGTVRALASGRQFIHLRPTAREFPQLCSLGLQLLRPRRVL